MLKAPHFRILFLILSVAVWLSACGPFTIPGPQSQVLPVPQVIAIAEVGSINLVWGWWLTGQENIQAQDDWEILVSISQDLASPFEPRKKEKATQFRTVLHDLEQGELYYIQLQLINSSFDTVTSNIIASVPSPQPLMSEMLPQQRIGQNATWSGANNIIYERLDPQDSIVRIYEHEIGAEGEKFLAAGAEPDFNVSKQKLAYRTLVDPILGSNATAINTLNPRSGGGVDATLGGDRNYIQPDWSPNGQELVCLGLNPNADQYGILRLSAQGNGLPQPLAEVPIGFENGQNIAQRSPQRPVWWPNKQTVAFDLYTYKQDDSLQYIARDILMVSSQDPYQVKELFVSPWNDFSPAFSSDGSKIAFFSDRAGYLAIWVYDFDDQHWAQWQGGTDMPNLSETAKLEWSPDGQNLLFTGRRPDGSLGVYSLSQ